jgi:hypothetical protein
VGWNGVQPILDRHGGTSLLWLDYDIPLQGFAQLDGPTPLTKGHANAVSSVAFSCDGKLLASGSDDGSIKVWDAATGKETQTLQGHQQQVGALAFSPDGKTLASASSGPDAVKIWDLATGGETVNLTDNEGPFGGNVTFSPDGKVLAAGARHLVGIWDMTTGKKHATIKGQGSNDSVFWNHCRPSFSADGKTLVLGSGTFGGVEGGAHLWNWSENKSGGSLNIEGECAFIGLAVDGKTLITLNKHAELTLWDFETSQERKTLKLKETFKDAPMSLDLLLYGLAGKLRRIGRWQGVSSDTTRNRVRQDLDRSNGENEVGNERRKVRAHEHLNGQAFGDSPIGRGTVVRGFRAQRWPRCRRLPRNGGELPYSRVSRQKPSRWEGSGRTRSDRGEREPGRIRKSLGIA